MKLWKGCCGLAVVLWACCGSAWAEDTPDTKNNCERKGGKHILWENDVITGKLFGRSDKWYTNGIKVYNSYEKDCIPGWWPTFLENRISGSGNGGYAIQTGNVVGQLMFTPKNLTTAAPQPMDRFWGGWLYMGIVAQRQPNGTRQGSKDELETLEVDLGVTGPISGAEQVQRVIHAATNSTMPYGWGNQIKTELGAQLNYSHIKRAWKYPDSGGLPHMDFSWHYGYAAGTLFDYVNGGATVRFGGRLTDEAPNVIESPSIGQFKKISDAFYFLARADMKGVAHNTFIDGSLLRKNPHASYLNSKRIVPQLTGGMVFEKNYNNSNDVARLSILIHRRGSEFRSPAGPGAIFNFATLIFECGL